MIIADVNVLIYAHNSSAKYHDAAKRWFETAVTGAETVGIPWAVAFGFIRLLSNPAVVRNPDRPEKLASIVASWFELPAVRHIVPGIRHLDIMRELFESTGGNSRLTTDVHIAALAVEFAAVVCTNDTDFARFSKVRTMNPCTGAAKVGP